MMKSIISAAGLLAAAVTAYTPPNGPNPTYGALITPNGDVPVVTGQNIDVTWSPKAPTAGVTVSLVLCNGPSTNCVRQSSAIVEGVSAALGKYTWSVPCDLPLGTANTASGYGMLIIVDGTGEYQYSTQFSVTKGAACSGSGTTTSSVSSSAPTTVTSSVSSSVSSVVTSSVSSRPTTTPASGVPTSTGYGSGWIQWSGSASATTLSTSVAPVPVSTQASTTRATSASVSVASATTSAKPSVFTGAAAMPTAFINAFAAVGAVGMVVLAL